MQISTRLNLATAKRFLIAAAILLPLALIVISFFVREPAGKRFLLLYVAPLFAAAPLWVITRLHEYANRLGFSALIDAVVLVLSFARFVLGEILPFSGHMLFLTYSGATTSTNWYRWVAFVLFVETTWFKLVLWDDPRTWSAGLALGVIAAAIFYRQR